MEINVSIRKGGFSDISNKDQNKFLKDYLQWLELFFLIHDFKN